MSRGRTGVHTSSLSPGLGLKQEIKAPPWIKEEEEQLPVSVPESSDVCVKSEESSLLQQTEHQEETQGEDSSETEGQTEHSSDTDDDDWEPFGCSAVRSTGLFPKYRPAPETSASVDEEDLSGAERKKHQCSVCRKRFGHKHVLQRHVRVHTGERPYSCSTCEKTFAQSDDLEKHLKTHTGEKPFSCSMCKKSFHHQNNLKYHMRRHGEGGAGGKTHECSVCRKRFGTKQKLEIHSRRHTGERPYSCSVCERAFALKGSLDKHVRSYRHSVQFSRGAAGENQGRSHRGQC